MRLKAMVLAGSVLAAITVGGAAPAFATQNSDRQAAQQPEPPNRQEEQRSEPREREREIDFGRRGFALEPGDEDEDPVVARVRSRRELARRIGGFERSFRFDQPLAVDISPTGTSRVSSEGFAGPSGVPAGGGRIGPPAGPLLGPLPPFE
jgi:hypothetical protein